MIELTTEQKESVQAQLAFMRLRRIQHKNCDLLDSVRASLPGLPPVQRLWLFRALAKGYCTDCGEAITGTCHCENDE